MCDEKVRIMKPLEEMDVIDDFLFTEIMADEEDGAEVCRMILSLALKREIGEISFTAQKAVPGVSESSHGIRMDAYITEHLTEDGTDRPVIRVYDVEPDRQSSKKKLLPRRSRYYGDLIDVQLFIPYNDGVRRIFLYVDGELPENAGEDDRKLKNLLRYIGKSTKDNVTDDLTDKLNDIVHRTKAKKGVGIRYMKSWEREKEIREEERMKSWEREREIREEERMKSWEREREIREEERIKSSEREKEIREESREEGREEERKNTETERKRADRAEARVRELEAKLSNITVY